MYHFERIPGVLTATLDQPASEDAGISVTPVMFEQPACPPQATVTMPRLPQVVNAWSITIWYKPVLL